MMYQPSIPSSGSEVVYFTCLSVKLDLIMAMPGILVAYCVPRA